MTVLILVVLSIICFGGGFAFPDNRYRWGGGCLGLLLLILVAMVLLGFIHVT